MAYAIKFVFSVSNTIILSLQFVFKGGTYRLLLVKTRDINCILGDKRMAFAPHTIGIPLNVKRIWK